MVKQKSRGTAQMKRGDCRSKREQRGNWYKAEEERQLSFHLLTRRPHLSSPQPLVSSVWLEWITSRTRIMVTAYYFTLCLTLQSVARAGSRSVHACCSRTCSREAETQNMSSNLLLSKNESLTLTRCLHSASLFTHKQDGLQVERFIYNHLQTGLSSAAEAIIRYYGSSYVKAPCWLHLHGGKPVSLSKQSSTLMTTDCWPGVVVHIYIWNTARALFFVASDLCWIRGNGFHHILSFSELTFLLSENFVSSLI